MILSKEQRRIIMDANPPEIERVHSQHMYIDWSWRGCGFGQLDIVLDKENGKITCSNELMSRKRVRQILHAYADFLADRIILDDDKDGGPPVDYLLELDQQRIDNLNWLSDCKIEKDHG